MNASSYVFKPHGTNGHGTSAWLGPKPTGTPHELRMQLQMAQSQLRKVDLLAKALKKQNVQTSDELEQLKHCNNEKNAVIKRLQLELIQQQQMFQKKELSYFTCVRQLQEQLQLNRSTNLKETKDYLQKIHALTRQVHQFQQSNQEDDVGADEVRLPPPPPTTTSLGPSQPPDGLNATETTIASKLQSILDRIDKALPILPNSNQKNPNVSKLLSPKESMIPNTSHFVLDEGNMLLHDLFEHSKERHSNYKSGQ